MLSAEIEKVGVKAEITGRPKHLYSIWNKMRNKAVDFEEVYDVRALRAIVPEVQDCYSVLGVVHNLWTPIPREFDDYISRPKGNLYQSLHTAVIGPGGKTLEVQIRTEAMHRQAEYGIAAHWRYKEAGRPARAQGAFDEKIAWLRQLLAWRDEVADWGKTTRQARLDDTIYVLTPQGKVIDLPAGATPVDFAYTLHTDLGHRCRGAKVDGQMVPLDTPLASGQRVEIVAAKTGGPSRDWLNAERGFVHEPPRAAQDPAVVQRQGARRDGGDGAREGGEGAASAIGAAQANLDELASRLGFKKPDELFAAVARDEINLRQLQVLKEKRGRSRGAQAAQGQARQEGQRADRRHGQPDDPARALLQAGAARSDPRLRHARQGRVGAPRGLREPEAARRARPRAADRDGLGQAARAATRST